MSSIMTLRFLIVVLAAVASSPAAWAATTTYVASNGKNSNNCTRNAPCATVQRAVNKSADGGEVQILTSGTFGKVVIDKSITITAVGVAANLGSVRIDKGGVIVALNGLHLNGHNATAVGIDIVKGREVHIQNCIVERFTGRAIQVAANVGTNVLIARSTVRNNAIAGLTVFGPSQAKLSIVDSNFEANIVYGMYFNGSKAFVNRTVFSGTAADNSSAVSHAGGTMSVSQTTAFNYKYGFFGSGVAMTLDSSTSHGNEIGVYVATKVQMSNSVVTGNTTGIDGGGTLNTRQNNTVDGNGTNVGGSVVVVPLAGV